MLHNTEYKGFSIPLIVEGEVYEENLNKLNLSKDWLIAQLKDKNINSVESVFFAAINTDGQLYLSKGLDHTKDIMIPENKTDKKVKIS